MEDFFDASLQKSSRTATNCFKITDFTAIKWFTDASGVEKDSTEYAPTPRSIAPLELALRVVDARQADWLAISGL
jgi:hypothetical protein